MELKTVYKWSALHNFVSVFLSEYTSISLNKKNVQNCIEYLHVTRLKNIFSSVFLVLALKLN